MENRMNYLQEFYSSFSIPFSFENGAVKWFPQADEVAPVESVVTQKLNEYKTNKAWSDLRKQRNQLLQQSDWRMASDYPGANQTEWQTYRQALRDITTQTPSLDSDGNLTGITWPTPPTD